MKRVVRKEIIQADKDRKNKIDIQHSLELLQVKKARATTVTATITQCIYHRRKETLFREARPM